MARDIRYQYEKHVPTAFKNEPELLECGKDILATSFIIDKNGSGILPPEFPNSTLPP
jgi:hypothetical protein